MIVGLDMLPVGSEYTTTSREVTGPAKVGSAESGTFEDEGQVTSTLHISHLHRTIIISLFLIKK